MIPDFQNFFYCHIQQQHYVGIKVVTQYYVTTPHVCRYITLLLLLVILVLYTCSIINNVSIEKLTILFHN